MAKHEHATEAALSVAAAANDAYLAFAAAVTAFGRAVEAAAQDVERALDHLAPPRRHEPVGPAPRRLWGEAEVKRRLRRYRRNP